MKRNILEKLRRGERCWIAEFALRGIGFCLLPVCALLVQGVVRQVQGTAVATPAEFALSVLVYISLTGALALLLVGPCLFKLMPTPPRALLP